jgi:hypothetical protein
MSKRLFAVIFILAAILRLVGVWSAQLWYDENFTLILSRLSLAQMLAATAGDTHPLLYYLLVWPIGQLLKSPDAPVWLLRLPSLLFSLASVWLFWSIINHLCFHGNGGLRPDALNINRRVAVAALVLMVVMPIQIYYAQEARMYALLEMLVLAGFLAVIQRRWLWFGVCGVLMLYTQNYGMYYWVALTLVALIRNLPDRATYKKVLLAAGLAGLAYLPWVNVLVGQMRNIQGTYWMQMTDVGAPALTLFNMLFMMLSSNAVIQIPILLVGFAWLFGSLLLVIFGKHHRPASAARTNYLLTVCIMAFLPLALAVLTSAIWQPVLHYRPLIASTPFLYLLMAEPVELLFDASGRFLCRRAIYAACFILPVILICDISIYAYSSYSKDDGSRLDLAYIQQHWQPGDVVLENSAQSWVNMTPYAPDLPRYFIPQCSSENGRLSAATSQVLGMQDAPSDLTYTRAWVIWLYSPLTRVAENCAQDLYHLSAPVQVTIDNEYIYYGLWLANK